MLVLATASSSGARSAPSGAGGPPVPGGERDAGAGRHRRRAVRRPGHRRRAADHDDARAVGRRAPPGAGRAHLGAARRRRFRRLFRGADGVALGDGLRIRRADVRSDGTPSLRERVSAYVALTKPRIIELLLVTTVPAMVLAAHGVPRLDLVLWTLRRRVAGRRRRERDQLLHRPRHRPAHDAHPASAAAGARGRSGGRAGLRAGARRDRVRA